MVRKQPKPWSRKGDGFYPPAARVVRSTNRYAPTTLDEIRSVIRDAETAAKEVRASGSHWAFSDAAVVADDHFIVESNDPDGRPGFSGQLLDVVAMEEYGCLSHDAQEWLRQQPGVIFDPLTAPPPIGTPWPIYLVHVRAGTRIYELYDILDRGDEQVEHSLAWELPQYAGPWAMETLGGAGGQTIAGAFSTGTHGGDVHLQPIADAVQAMHFLGPEGREWWLERDLAPGIPLVDDDRLKRKYPNAVIRRDSDMFNAALVSVGRFGVLYSVVLRAVRQYALNQQSFDTTWGSIKGWATNPADPIFTTNRFISILVNPQSKIADHKEHDAWVTKRGAVRLVDAGANPKGRAERRGSNLGNSDALGASCFLTLICRVASAQALHDCLDPIISDLEDVRDAALKAAAAFEVAATAALFVPFPNPPLAQFLHAKALTAATVAAVAEIPIAELQAFFYVIGTGTLGGFLADVLDWCVRHDHVEILRRISSWILGSQKPDNVVAISYAVLDAHNYLDTACEAQGDSIELFFDASKPDLLDFMDRVFTRVDQLQTGNLPGVGPQAFVGYICIRYMCDTNALLGMQEWYYTCSVEIACSGYNDQIFEAFEADALACGGKVHWGQRNHLTMAQVEHTYASIDKWRKVLSEFTDNGRLAGFSTAFSRSHGLEIVQPRIGVFVMHPLYGAIGGSALAQWDAPNNPPECQVYLQVGGGLRQLQTSLQGSNSVIREAGPVKVSLSIDRELNNRRTGRAVQSVDVVGFGPSYPGWRFDTFANCESVGSDLMWTATPIDPSEWSPELEVHGIAVRIRGGETWRLKIPGLPLVTFDQAEQAHTFSPPLPIAGPWKFIYSDPTYATCATGTSPTLSVDFTFV